MAKSKQLMLPGMGDIKREKKPKPKPEVTYRKPRKDKLHEELSAGNRPMFMTAGEIVKHANLTDAGMRNNTWLPDKKDSYQLSSEKNMMAKKLTEAKTGTARNSHTPKRYQGEYDRFGAWKPSQEESLHESIARQGLTSPIDLIENEASFSRLGSNKYETRHSINLYEGHHRVAAMRNINPKQFIAINWE